MAGMMCLPLFALMTNSSPAARTNADGALLCPAAAGAHAMMESGSHIHKIVLEVSDSLPEAAATTASR
jgi:hypothetical protein